MSKASQARNLAKIPMEQGIFTRTHRSTLGMTIDGKKITPACALLLNKTFGLSKGLSNDGLEHKMDKLSERELAAAFGCSKSTVYRHMKALEEGNYITKERGSHNMEYAANVDLDGLRFDVDEYLLTTEWEKDDGEFVVFQKTTAIIFSYIKNLCMNHKGSGKFTCTPTTLGKQVGFSERTVRTALALLIKVGFLRLPDCDKGTRGKASTYTLNSIFRNVKKYKKKSLNASQQVAIATADEKKANARVIEAINEGVERARYYSIHKQQAELRADDNLQRARNNPEFLSVEKALAEKEREQSKIEAFGLDGLPACLATVAQLKAHKNEILKAMGMTENDFEPIYTCPKCSDTGYLPNGVACDCYRKHNE